ncbi:alpha/beta hydrolase [Algoriphagus halophytocola]|uniref:Alpha/beta hydrolase n=1 Tax=Algoriphagus halophytocola TaxID=2991499 RepID=A0ABY6ME03_9BACT|nr:MULTISPECIES: alpha/beta hydrolase [unclassified Algoriphagus]UZD21130.1 alpha/beta hydrolase [Algoriphagus sp. TR-M5]WBL42299.1 alpha/beta hydrolase [Algoriphagus sp. TR-M9]
MKNFLLVLILCIFTFSSFAQDITGQWNGALRVQGTQLRLVFHIEKTDEGYKSTMDSPDQAAFGIPVTSTSFENDVIKISITNANIQYEGTLGEDSIIIGVFKQAGQTFPMNLSRSEVQSEEVKRPQEPTKPYGYHSEDLFFENKEAGIKLAGTLTLPKEGGNFPAVILISGSGPQNRNEELMGHKPFLVLSDFLTRNGIAVLRFDDRGTASSEGNFTAATSIDFATDVAAAVDYLKTRKEINPAQIGLIGHSEGGIIAPMVANSNPQDVDFIVLLAGTGIRGDQLLLLQQALIGKAAGMTPAQLEENDMISRQAFEIMLKDLSEKELQQEIAAYMTQVYRNIPPENVPNGMTEADFVTAQVKQLTSPWMSSFIKYDPSISLEKVTCPVLAINGEKDLQVPPKENLGAIKAALEKGGNPDITTVELAGLNHLFQEANTGAPSEYASIDQTFAPAAMEVVLSWIKERVE